MPFIPDSSEFTKYRKYRAAAADYANGFAFNRRRVTYVPSPPLGAYTGFIRDSEIALSVGPVVSESTGGDAPVANFSAVPLSTNVGVTVTFTDLSTNSPKTWLWNFGDGETSAAQNPTHVYTVPDIYNITLTVTNDAGTSTVDKKAYITILAGSTIDAKNWSSPTAEVGYYETTCTSSPPPVTTDKNDLGITFSNIPTSYGMLELNRVSAIQLQGAAPASYDSIAGLPGGVSVVTSVPSAGALLLTFTPNVNIVDLTGVTITFKSFPITITELRLRLLAAPPPEERTYNFSGTPVGTIGDYYQAGPVNITPTDFTGTVVDLDFIGIPTSYDGLTLTQVQHIVFVNTPYHAGRTVDVSGLSKGVTGSAGNDGVGGTMVSFSSKVPISELEATKLNLTFNIGTTLSGPATLRLYP